MQALIVFFCYVDFVYSTLSSVYIMTHSYMHFKKAYKIINMIYTSDYTLYYLLQFFFLEDLVSNI